MNSISIRTYSYVRFHSSQSQSAIMDMNYWVYVVIFLPLFVWSKPLTDKGVTRRASDNTGSPSTSGDLNVLDDQRLITSKLLLRRGKRNIEVLKERHLLRVSCHVTCHTNYKNCLLLENSFEAMIVCRQSQTLCVDECAVDLKDDDN